MLNNSQNPYYQLLTAMILKCPITVKIDNTNWELKTVLHLRGYFQTKLFIDYKIVI